MKNIIEEETDFFSGKNLTRFLVLLTIFLILLFSYIYIASHLNWGFNMSDKNTIGDAIGGISAPFIGISTCILTFIAFYVQYDFNKKQSVFIKKQQINEFISEFNQTFNLITIDKSMTDPLQIMHVNNAINNIIETCTPEVIPTIKTDSLNLILEKLNSQGFYHISNNLPLYYNTTQKFTLFMDILIKEFSRVEMNEIEKLNIINNFIIKFEISTTPEIMNFLTLNVLTHSRKVVVNKDFIIKSLKQHYGVNKSIFNIYE
jgi:hypothetical protein